MIAKFVVLIFAFLHVGLLESTTDQTVDTGDVLKRSRNPYSWMNEDKRNDRLYEWIKSNENVNDFENDQMMKRARNPYSWMNYQGKRSVRNPYSWMAYGEKRAPLNPYSWMYTLQKRAPFRYFRNPYSWQNSPASW